MGVPKFFRWVAERYPAVITPLKCGDLTPFIDNLYLDMNSIIHYCSHADNVHSGGPVPTEREIVEAIFAYVEKIFAAVKPRQYFLMAIDGVAPRAKMNQQRQRRYRAGFERVSNAEKALEEALARGDAPPPDGPDALFDTNSITPGTAFMEGLTEHFHYFIQRKLQTDPAWQNCKQVIFSGHDHPGEGEHKIVEFIRGRKAAKNYSPNETHCMYGLDADLVMLALATHEPRFVLLREIVTFGKQHVSKFAAAAAATESTAAYSAEDEFVFFHIQVLRDYLYLEWAAPIIDTAAASDQAQQHYHHRAGLNDQNDPQDDQGNTTTVPANALSNSDFERAIDDFVFMCFFVGNDFLPALPTVAIQEGHLLDMLRLYRTEFVAKKRFLTLGGGRGICWEEVELFLRHLAQLEGTVLLQRERDEAAYQQQCAAREAARAAKAAARLRKQRERENFYDPAAALREEEDRNHAADFEPVASNTLVGSSIAQQTEADADGADSGDDDPAFKATLLLSAFKERYYQEKHQFSPPYNPCAASIVNLRRHYVEALTWVWQYYYHGVPSWGWFFPHHYAPMASDLRGLAAVASVLEPFEKGAPFLPHQQLLAVLPPMSARLLPQCYWPLLQDSDSILAEFLPKEPDIDREGTRAAWEGVVRIPFIDEPTLRAAFESVQPSVLPADAARNKNDLALRFAYNPKCPAPKTVTNRLFPPIEDCRVESARTPLPPCPSPTTAASICPGHFAGVMEGWASLRALVSTLQPANERGVVSVFGRPTRYQSLMLRMGSLEGNNGDATTTGAPPLHAIARSLLGKEVLAGYPHFRRGRVAAVESRWGKISIRFGGKGHRLEDKEERYAGDQSSQFVQRCAEHQKKLRSVVGLDLSAVTVLVHVRCFANMRIRRQKMVYHSLRHYASEELSFPIPLVMRIAESGGDSLTLVPAQGGMPTTTPTTVPGIAFREDERFQERELDRITDMSEDFLYVGPNQPTAAATVPVDLFGSQARLVDDGESTAEDEWMAEVTVFTQPQGVPKEILHFASVTSWRTMEDAAEACNLSLSTFQRLCGSLKTSLAFGEQELGLRLAKLTGHDKQARAGFCKWVPTQTNPWYFGADDSLARMVSLDRAPQYRPQPGGTSRGPRHEWFASDRALELVRQYKENFAPIVDWLENCPEAKLTDINPSGFMTGPWVKQQFEDDICPQLKAFFEAANIVQEPMRPAAESVLTPDHVALLENFLEQQPARTRERIIMRRVKRGMMLSTSLRTATGYRMTLPVDREQRFRVGARVVNCQLDGRAPFGAQGTLVRLFEQSAEVVFDQPFESGSRLFGLLGTPRGAVLLLSHLLNISVEERDASVSDLLINVFRAATMSSRERDHIIEPFPKVRTPGLWNVFALDPKKPNYDLVRGVAQDLPNTRELLAAAQSKEAMDALFGSKERLVRGLNAWILNAPRSFLLKLDPSVQIPSLRTPHQFLLAVSGSEHERNFRRLKAEFGSSWGFHGSRRENWHSILRNGLRNYSGTANQLNGCVHGSGVYFGLDLRTSLHYSTGPNAAQQQGPFAGLYGAAPHATSSSGYDHHLQAGEMILLCLSEVINTKYKYHKGSIECWTVEDEQHIMPRIFFAYASQSAVINERVVVGVRNDSPTFIAEIDRAMRFYGML